MATRVPCSGLAPMLFCPLGSPAPEASVPPTTAPLRSGCCPSTPLSMMATFTPAPFDTCQAAEMPYSLSQYSLSRQESANAEGAVSRALQGFPRPTWPPVRPMLSGGANRVATSSANTHSYRVLGMLRILSAMPSRMSCSLEVAAVMEPSPSSAKRWRMRRQTRAPAPMTSTRPGCM